MMIGDSDLLFSGPPYI